MALWRLTITEDADSRESMRSWIRDNRRIAMGWGNVGNLTTLNAPDSIQEEANKIYSHLPNVTVAGRQLWDFYREMQVGDLVILVRETRYAVVKVEGDYLFDNQKCLSNMDCFHQRKISFTNYDPDQLWNESVLVDGYNMHWALVRRNLLKKKEPQLT